MNLSTLSFRGTAEEAKKMAADIFPKGAPITITQKGEIQVISFLEPKDTTCKLQMKRLLEADSSKSTE